MPGPPRPRPSGGRSPSRYGRHRRLARGLRRNPLSAARHRREQSGPPADRFRRVSLRREVRPVIAPGLPRSSVLGAAPRLNPAPTVPVVPVARGSRGELSEWEVLGRRIHAYPPYPPPYPPEPADVSVGAPEDGRELPAWRRELGQRLFPTLCLHTGLTARGRTPPGSRRRAADLSAASSRGGSRR